MGYSKTKIQKDSVEIVLTCINYDNYVNLVHVLLFYYVT